MKKITAKFHGYCAESNRLFRKGHEIYFDTTERKCYCLTSKKALDFDADQSLSNMIQANEEVHFDKFCIANNI
jgi:hypothetical protein